MLNITDASVGVGVGVAAALLCSALLILFPLLRFFAFLLFSSLLSFLCFSGDCRQVGSFGIVTAAKAAASCLIGSRVEMVAASISVAFVK